MRNEIETEQIYLRGDIVWVDNDINISSSIQGGKRPYLIISNNLNNKYSDILTAVPLTSRYKKYLPTHHKILINDIENTVLAEQITCISKENIIDYYDTINDEDLKKVEDKIKIQLNLREV